MMYKLRRIIFLMAITAIAMQFAACSSTQGSGQKQSSPSQKMELADINIQLGIAYLQSGDPARAKQKFLMAMQQAPNYSASWYGMGYYLEKIGDKSEAERYYLKAVQLAPHAGAAQNNYGTFLCRQKQYKKAIEHFMIAVNDPSYLSGAEAYENAGICALQIPDKQLAENYFQKAIQIDPQRPLALMELTKLKSAQGEYRVALEYMERYLSSYQPTKATLTLAIGIAQKAHDQALEIKYTEL